MVTRMPSSNKMLWFYHMMCVSYKALSKYSEMSSFPRTMNYNWWHTRPLWNHSRSPLASAVACFPLQMPSHKRWKGWGKKIRHCLPLTKDSFVWPHFDVGLTFLLNMRLHENFPYFQLFTFSFLADGLSKFFFWTIVHGLKDSLHSIGDLNNSACEIHQWCTPPAGGGGGKDVCVLNFHWNYN